jgi:hypothetical protein
VERADNLIVWFTRLSLPSGATELVLAYGLARIPHKLVEQMGGRGVRRLENTELYDDTLYRPEPHRL